MVVGIVCAETVHSHKISSQFWHGVCSEPLNTPRMTATVSIDIRPRCEMNDCDSVFTCTTPESQMHENATKHFYVWH